MTNIWDRQFIKNQGVNSEEYKRLCLQYLQRQMRSIAKCHKQFDSDVFFLFFPSSSSKLLRSHQSQDLTIAGKYKFHISHTNRKNVHKSEKEQIL